MNLGEWIWCVPSEETVPPTWPHVNETKLKQEVQGPWRSA